MSRLRGLWLLLLLPPLAGCSGAGIASGLTGGSVPIGKQAVVLTGTVVDEQQSTQAVPNAGVTITNSQQQVFRGQTDANGRFTTQVPEEDDYTVTIDPPTGRGEFRSRRSQVRVDSDQVDVLVPLPRADSPPEPNITSLAIIPETVTLRVGDQFLFVLVAQEAITGRPVWTVHGGVGDIDATGLFTARRPATGRIRARLGGQRVEAAITVLPALP